MMRGQLTTLSKRLTIAVNMIDPELEERKAVETRAQIYEGLTEKMEREHAAVLNRKQMIEVRKEFIEGQRDEKQQHVVAIAKKMKEKKVQAEKERLANDEIARAKAKEKERQRLMNEQSKQDKVQSYKRTTVGEQAFADIDAAAIEKLTEEDIDSIQLKHLEKMKEETSQKLKMNAKRVDYIERAKRLDEIPLLAQAVQKEKDDFVERSQAAHAEALAIQARLQRMIAAKEEVLGSMMAAQRDEYKEAAEQFNRDMQVQRAERQRQEDARREREDREVNDDFHSTFFYRFLVRQTTLTAQGVFFYLARSLWYFRQLYLSCRPAL
jgi:translation initiation factor 3 subunit A